MKLVLIGACLLTLTGFTGQAPPDVGDQAPLFSLADANDRPHKLRAYTGKFIVLEWTNKDCPYVKKHYGTNNMQTMQLKAKELGAVWFTICSSAGQKEGYMNQEQARAYVKSSGMHSAAYLLDFDGNVGRMYGAKTSPHIFIIDPKGKIIYSGAVDDKPTTDPEDVKKARNHVLTALGEAMSGMPITRPKTVPYGCPIRY